MTTLWDITVRGLYRVAAPTEARAHELGQLIAEKTTPDANRVVVEVEIAE